MEQLEKIEIIRERIGVTYREAADALEEAAGDLVQALALAEEKVMRGWGNRLMDKSEEIYDHLKEYISKGNKTKVRLKKDGRTIAEFPATVGAVGVLAALASTQLAVIAGIGTVAAITSRVTLEIDKPNGETKVINLDRHKQEREL